MKQFIALILIVGLGGIMFAAFSPQGQSFVMSMFYSVQDKNGLGEKHSKFAKDFIQNYSAVQVEETEVRESILYVPEEKTVFNTDKAVVVDLIKGSSSIAKSNVPLRDIALKLAQAQSGFSDFKNQKCIGVMKDCQKYLYKFKDGRRLVYVAGIIGFPASSNDIVQIEYWKFERAIDEIDAKKIEKLKEDFFL